MTAIVLPDIDRSTIEELRKKIPNLSEIELPQMPSMEKVGKTADDTIDRLLGRQKAPVWPWIAAGPGSDGPRGRRATPGPPPRRRPSRSRLRPTT